MENDRAVSEYRNNQFFDKVISKYGVDAQCRQMIEESAELIQALNKFWRKPSPENIENVQEELADVKLMMEQMERIFDKRFIARKYFQKRKKLEQKLEETDES